MAACALLRYGRKTGIFLKESIFARLNPQNYSNRVFQVQKCINGCFLQRCSSFAMDNSSNVTTDRSTDRSNIDRTTTNEHYSNSNSNSQDSLQTKLLRVAIIGEANSGKSTLTNCLIGEKICAVTAVPHTTRRRAMGVFTVEDSQIVLLDTPGIVSVPQARRLKMTREHMRAPGHALYDADVIAVLIDAADRKRSMKIPETILTHLENHADLPSVLILNKIDMLKTKVTLLDIATVLTEDRERDEWGYKDVGGWSKFEHVFMISSRTGDGVSELKQYFAAKSKPAEWLFPADTSTDQSFEQIMHEIFREKVLQLYEHEIPWQIRQVNVLCEPREGHWRIHHKLYCRTKSQRRCVMEKLTELRELALADLEDILGQRVELTVDVSHSAKVGFQTPLHSY